MQEWEPWSHVGDNPSRTLSEGCLPDCQCVSGPTTGRLSLPSLPTMEELGMEDLYQEIASLDGILFGQHQGTVLHSHWSRSHDERSYNATNLMP